MSILFRCFLLFCIFPVTILAEDNNLSGIQKYEAGDFSGASTDFLKQYWESEDPAEKGFLLFNLGNSLVRENKYSGAYGAYLSSRKYAYNDPDLEYNLKMMREKIKDDLKDEITPASLSDYISFVFLYLTPKLLIILFGVFCCLSILFFLFVRNTVSKNTVLIVSLLFILISGAFAFVFKLKTSKRKYGCLLGFQITNEVGFARVTSQFFGKKT